MIAKSDFSFRGYRDYLHGTSVFNYLIGQDPNPRKVDLQFNKTTGKQCIIFDEPQEGFGSCVAVYRSLNMSRFFYESDEPIVRREACNQTTLLRSITISETDCFFSLPQREGTFVELVVAGYKELLSVTFGHLHKKYLFARISLDFLPESGQISILHKRRIGENFFEGILKCDSQNIGKIIFGAT
jgi:hypothetical protein